MTNDALREREAVVAWLRGEQAYWFKHALSAETRTCRRNFTSRAIATLRAADAIERGAHLKDTQP